MTPDTSRAQALKPVAVTPGDGEVCWWFGNLPVNKTVLHNPGETRQNRADRSPPIRLAVAGAAWMAICQVDAQCPQGLLVR